MQVLVLLLGSLLINFILGLVMLRKKPAQEVKRETEAEAKTKSDDELARDIAGLLKDPGSGN